MLLERGRLDDGQMIFLSIPGQLREKITAGRLEELATPPKELKEIVVAAAQLKHILQALVSILHPIANVVIRKHPEMKKKGS